MTKTESKEFAICRWYLHLVHFVIGVEKLLHLCGVDVLPPSDDHVLDAALDGAVAQRVEAGHVPACANNTLAEAQFTGHRELRSLTTKRRTESGSL